LFDVLDINRGTGNTTVSATGFSFSCGYPTNINSEFILDSEGSGWWDGNWSTQNATGIITIPETRKPISHHIQFNSNSVQNLA
jgi:hypothetical protein